MNYSVLIPYQKGDGHRERNVDAVIQYYLDKCPNNVKVVISEQNTKSDFSKFKSSRFIHLHNINTTSRFNKSIAWNDGMRYIAENLKTEFVLMCDADIIVEERYLEDYGLRDILPEVNALHPFTAIVDLQRYETTDFIKAYKSNLQFTINKLRIGYRCYGGAIYVRMTSYLEIGGYDERFDAWGHEDDVFFYALKSKYGSMKVRRLRGMVFHLFHLPANTPDYIKSNKYKELTIIKASANADIIRRGKVDSYCAKNRRRNGFPMLYRQVLKEIENGVGNWNGFNESDEVERYNRN